MRWHRTITSLFATFALTASAFGAADGIFPASTPEASKGIQWDNGYFVINGTPTFLSSGEIHYARVPRELWKDRILRAKAMGLNTIQTYVMWNAHEGRDGQFDFSGNLDLDAWLSLIQECGMYAIVRPGPYVCAEWENGGLPSWLCSRPDMKVRTDDAQFLKYADRFESKVFQIIAKHQIHKGGNVLMVQLENEYPNRWGTDTNAYLTNLYDLARSSGLEIPLFNSGLHHGDDPAGSRPFAARTSPWFSTEFWTGWIGLHGDMNAQKAEQKVRGTWKIIGFGGGGYDYYVVHGGTNFGYSKGNEVTASYDYASPIGEAGQLRKVYFPMKRAAMFAQTFSDLLTSSKDDPNFVASTTATLQTFTRTSPNGNAIFLADAARFQGGNRGRGGQNPAPPPPQAIQTQIKLADGRQIPSGAKTLRIEPGEIRPILTDVFVHQDPKTRISQPVVFDYAATAILTRIRLSDTTYVVCHGAAGDEGEVAIKGRPAPLAFKYPAAGVETVEIPGANAKLLVMNTELADRTWIVGSGGDQALVIGADYASPDGTLEFKQSGTAIVYNAKGRSDVGTGIMGPVVALPALGNWKFREGAAEALPQTNVAAWPVSKEPKPMEQYDDYPNGWGWYRATVHRDAAGEVRMKFTGAGDVIRVFVDGKRVAGDKGGATLSLKAGDNEVAVLCWNDGRPKMYNFTGPTKLNSAKGIWGPVTLDENPQKTIDNWHFHPGLADLQETPLIATVTNWKEFLADAGAASWTNGPGAERAAQLPGFYRTEFALDPPSAGMHVAIALRTTGLRAGSVWVNGHNLGPYKNNGNNATSMYIPECWLQKGGNTLVIFDAEGAEPSRSALEYLETSFTVRLPS